MVLSSRPDRGSQTVCASQSFHVFGKGVGGHERQEVIFQALEIGVVEDLSRRILDRPVHALGLAIRPRVIRFGERVLYAVCKASAIEHVRTPLARDPATVLWEVGKRHSIVVRTVLGRRSG